MYQPRRIPDVPLSWYPVAVVVVASRIENRGRERPAPTGALEDVLLGPADVCGVVGAHMRRAADLSREQVEDLVSRGPRRPAIPGSEATLGRASGDVGLEVHEGGPDASAPGVQIAAERSPAGVLQRGGHVEVDQVHLAEGGRHGDGPPDLRPDLRVEGGTVGGVISRRGVSQRHGGDVELPKLRRARKVGEIEPWRTRRILRLPPRIDSREIPSDPGVPEVGPIGDIGGVGVDDVDLCAGYHIGQVHSRFARAAPRRGKWCGVCRRSDGGRAEGTDHDAPDREKPDEHAPS